MKKILFIFAVFVFPVITYGAAFHFDHPYEVKVEETLVTLLLDTHGEKVNALAGSIVLPEDLEISKVSTGDSVVVLWIEPPIVKDGILNFSGIAPGGFQGDGKVFSFTLKKSSLENVALEVVSGEVRRNDANGSLIPHRSLKTMFVLSESTGGSAVIFDDSVAPESFLPTIASDPEFFEGARFVAFSTQDKGTGIFGYESASAWFGKPKESSWKPATSPLLISKAEHFKVIYIKAIDNAGNTHVEKVSGPYRYAVTIFEVILVLLALCVLLFYARRSSQRLS